MLEGKVQGGNVDCSTAKAAGSEDMPEASLAGSKDSAEEFRKSDDVTDSSGTGTFGKISRLQGLAKKKAELTTARIKERKDALKDLGKEKAENASARLKEKTENLRELSSRSTANSSDVTTKDFTTKPVEESAEQKRNVDGKPPFVAGDNENEAGRASIAKKIIHENR
mmetsp:Transcript_14237/g.41778  ORF Transcript_14237/g.41778 Transcript_14237/m.41778 type:complete len:168 (-) Transcript_14237:2358-2861(-)